MGELFGGFQSWSGFRPHFVLSADLGLPHLAPGLTIIDFRQGTVSEKRGFCLVGWISANEKAVGVDHGPIVEVPKTKSAGIPEPNTSLDKNSHIVTPAKLAAYNIGGCAKTSTSLNSSGCKSSYSF